MNKQELFTTIYNRMVTQGTPAFEGGECLYQGPNNTHCAIGCVLPPEHPVFEVLHGIRWVMEHHTDLVDILGDDICFLESIQHAHDYPADDDKTGEDWVTEFKLRMDDVARCYKLQVPHE